MCDVVGRIIIASSTARRSCSTRTKSCMLADCFDSLWRHVPVADLVLIQLLCGVDLLTYSAI